MALLDRNSAPRPKRPGAPAEDGEAGFAFARYRLFPQRWLLLADDKPVELKSRAFEVLVALVEGCGELVTKEALRARVWPCTVVEPQNIDLQIHALRKALGPDRHLIRTDTGRGYRLAAAVRKIGAVAEAASSQHTAAGEPVAGASASNLPTSISPLIGRARELAELQQLIGRHRLVTLTGAGGIGKTQLGLELARLLLTGFADGIWNIELASLVDPDLVPAAVARTLGIKPDPGLGPAEQLTLALQRKHLLLVLDNCEHVIGTVARMAETLLHGAPSLHILATSQEPLVAEGEHVYRVDPLKVPPRGVAEAARVMEHSAVQLFVERARAADPRFVLDDRAAVTVGDVCRDLDGIPLAIELAAARVATLGLAEIAKRLDNRFRLLTGGRRAALKRHQTLRATLDWSYGLLEEGERAVLRRAAIFAGSFSLDGAGVVAQSGGIGQSEAADHVADLVSKSLITFDGLTASPRYRLLDTTRAYALEKLAENGEFEATARCHAEYYRALLEAAEASWQTTPAAELAIRYGPELDNIRAALTWAFEAEGDPQTGVALAAAAIPLWTLLSVLGDCRDLVSRALSRVDKGSDQQRRHEMLLQAALGRSSMWAKGAVTEAELAAERAIELAEHLDDPEYQLRALYNLWIYRLRIGEYRTSLAIARRFRQIAQSRSDVPATLTGARLEGVALFHLGDHARARAALYQAIGNRDPDVRRSFVVRFGLDQRVSSLACLARILWLQGFPDQAARAVLTAVEEARVLDHANSLCIALCFGACNLAAMSGDVRSVEEFAPVLTDFAERHGLGMWQADGVAFKGWLAVRQGDVATGVRLLTTACGGFREGRLGLHQTVFPGALAEALGMAGRVQEGLAVIDESIKESTRTEAKWCLAELQRIRAELLLRGGLPADVATAETGLLEAIDIAIRQGALSLQLRAAKSLAGLWQRQGRKAEALALLAPVYCSFTEGFDTPDLQAAKALVQSIEGSQTC